MAGKAGGSCDTVEHAGKNRKGQGRLVSLEETAEIMIDVSGGRG